ncbi:MAG: LAGLIDADG family homing endonuclease, partial [Candidatus Aenigmarchaeota archaeon]|nr:LAGLIDADG family homing endonuclease [Candidatus Aenigmarchaeota archaeon]
DFVVPNVHTFIGGMMPTILHNSQLGFQLAVNVQLPPERGGLGRGCIFIDSENTFSPNRIVSMAKALGINPDEALRNVFVSRAFNSEHQISLVEGAKELIEEKNVGLIIVDSLTSHFRADYLGRGELALRQQKLNRHLHVLQRYADAYNLAVYVTNQVMAKPDVLFGDPTAPVGGNVLAHMCVAADSLVVTKEGLKKIDEVHNPMNVLGYLKNFSFHDILEKAERIDETVEINHTLEASKNHRVFVFREKEGFKEIFVENLKENDYLILPRKINITERKLEIPEFNYEEIFIIKNSEEVKKCLRKNFSLKDSDACKKFTGITARQLRRVLNQGYPTRKEVIEKIKLLANLQVEKIETAKHKKIERVSFLTPSLAKFLGYLYGDGAKDFYNNSVRIREERYEVIEYYSNLFDQIFGIKPRITKVKGKKCYQLSIANKYVANVLKYLLSNIHKLFECDEETIREFMRGIFDAEGYVRNVVTLTQADRKFLILLKLLLSRLGIHSTISIAPPIYYRLEVSKRDFESIGFTAQDKQEKIKFQRKSRSERIPIKKGLVAKVLKELNIKVKFKHPECFLTFDELNLLCKSSETTNEIFGNLLNFYFEKVFSLKPKKKTKLIDIETTCGNFLANGYLVHNSTFRIYMRKGKGGTRIARLVDAPNLPETEAIFKITEEGIKDAD